MTENAASPPDALVKLRGVVAAFPATGYAVVDGGLFPDLPALLRHERLFARSLFLEKADAQLQAAGPWLAALDQAPEAMDKVFALVGDRPAAVFWSCGAGEAVLWRHLRGLNMARIPCWAAAGEAAPSMGDVKSPKYEAVMFRHWDPRVLGALLPCLDSASFARIVGPAMELAFHAPDAGGTRRVLHDACWQKAPLGLLTLKNDSLLALNDRRVNESRRRIVSYLREVAPEHTCGIADDELMYQVAYSERVGLDLGIRTERAHAQWAFLMVISKGHVANEPKVIRFISSPDRSPDAQVDQTLRHAIEAARYRDRAI